MGSAYLAGSSHISSWGALAVTDRGWPLWNVGLPRSEASSWRQHPTRCHCLASWDAETQCSIARRSWTASTLLPQEQHKEALALGAQQPGAPGPHGWSLPSMTGVTWQCTPETGWRESCGRQWRRLPPEHAPERESLELEDVVCSHLQLSRVR